MATIQDTINEIEEFQKEVLNAKHEDEFCKDLLRITSVIYLDYLSHAVLDGARKLDLSSIPYAKKYFELSNLDFLMEQIKINSIGHLFNIWTVYENYLRKKSIEIYGTAAWSISKVFADILKKINTDQRDKINDEFEVFQNTRNSFHNGGIFQHESTNEKQLGGNKYIFLKGEPVKPVRNMDIIQTIWEHFLLFNKIEITSKP